MTIKLGMQVIQVLPAPITGVVVKKQFIEATDTFQYMVESPSADGDLIHRWFEEKDLTLITVVETPGAPA